LLPVLAEGYILAGADSVPRDWEAIAPDTLVDEVRRDLARLWGGGVVVLHDAGGDRTATLAALPALIDALRADGYTFDTLGGLLGLDRATVMPPAEDALTRLDGISFRVVSVLGQALVWIFWIAVAAGTLRAALVLLLAHLRRAHVPPAGPLPPVTVVIPAYNEAAVIVTSVRAALASDHPDLRVIVVDDGSTDGTSARVAEAFAAEPRLRLIRQANGGKWAALNAAYALVESGVVVALDADSLMLPDAATLMARHFTDPRVGAVAGYVKVGNRRGLLTALQSVEYVTAQSIDRRAAELIRAMLVVPGAIGAWRAEAVRAAGGLSGDTITEDADLTVAIQRAGWRVVFEPQARSLTEAPEGARAFLRQRLRWTFGMMQTAWKHRGALRANGPCWAVSPCPTCGFSAWVWGCWRRWPIWSCWGSSCIWGSTGRWACHPAARGRCHHGRGLARAARARDAGAAGLPCAFSGTSRAGCCFSCRSSGWSIGRCCI
jgi:peptidoglycan-N-acetylglucosamine deacetylase